MHSNVASILRVQEAPADIHRAKQREDGKTRDGQLSSLFEELFSNTSLMTFYLCLTTVITMGARKYRILGGYIVTPRV